MIDGYGAELGMGSKAESLNEAWAPGYECDGLRLRHGQRKREFGSADHRSTSFVH